VKVLSSPSRQDPKENLVFCRGIVTEAIQSGRVRARLVYEGPPEGAKQLANQLRAASFTVTNGPAPEHPYILVEEVRVILWVTVEEEPSGRSLRELRASVGRLMSQYPGARVEIDNVPG
jgi:hypothetical protein